MQMPVNMQMTPAAPYRVGNGDSPQHSVKGAGKKNKRNECAANRQVPSQAESSAQVIVKHLDAGCPDAANEHLDSIISTLARTSCKAFYHSLIHSCGLLGSPRSAMWCAVRMVRVGLKPNIVTFNSLIDACAKTRNINLAVEVWEIMSSTDVAANIITYNAMINAFCQAGDLQRAEEWVERMFQDKIQPDTVTYGAMISLCNKTGNVDSAEKWFIRMSKAGVKADRGILNCMINVCAKANQPEKAEQWMMKSQQMNLRPDERAFNSLINAYLNRGAFEHAEYWLDRMLQDGLHADKNILASILQARAKAGDAAKVVHWLNRMSACKLYLDLGKFNGMLTSLAQAGSVEGATCVIEKMVEARVSPNKRSFHCIIEAAANAGNMDAAERWTQEMVKSRMLPDWTTLQMLEAAALKASERSHAMAGACSGQKAAWAYCVLTLAFLHIGDRERAQQWQESMLAEARLKQFFPMINTIVQSGGNMRRALRPGDVGLTPPPAHLPRASSHAYQSEPIPAPQGFRPPPGLTRNFDSEPVSGGSMRSHRQAAVDESKLHQTLSSFISAPLRQKNVPAPCSMSKAQLTEDLRGLMWHEVSANHGNMVVVSL